MKERYPSSLKETKVQAKSSLGHHLNKKRPLTLNKILD